jgi:hypothetical protein
MTNKQSWGNNWEEEFNQKFYPIITEGWGEMSNKRQTYYDIEQFIHQLLTSKSEQMEGEKRTIPGRVCINAESHLFGKCFQCEESKGFNAGISACIELLKK